MSKYKDELQKDLKPVSALPVYFQHVFSEFSKFNPMQTRAFEAAFHGNQNLLINAPTSAGKTNVALLCVLRMIDQWLQASGLTEEYSKFVAENVGRNLSKQKRFQFSLTSECDEGADAKPSCGVMSKMS